MVKHIVMWDFIGGLTLEEKREYAAKIKHGLEGLFPLIEGITAISVQTEFLGSSNCDIMLISEHTDGNALRFYQSNEEHLKVAAIVRSVTTNRRCADFEA